MTGYRATLVGLLVLFLVINALYLYRVPGLMGDEASEGQNVFELLERGGITLQGERSYIGPLIDYVRVPFITVFGYTALAVRVPMLLASLLTFLLAASVFRRWFGPDVSLFPLVAMAFSLPYLTHQRLGWAITLFPFFFFLIVWLAQRSWPYKWLLVGLAAGVGLHTHVMFAPTIAALAVGGLIHIVTGPTYAKAPAGKPVTSEASPLAPRSSGAKWGRATRGIVLAELRQGVSGLLLLLAGFWAAFSSQFVVLQLFPEDQGDPLAVGELMSERWRALPDLLPHILSGSSYVAHYTGVEFTPGVNMAAVWILGILVISRLALRWRDKVMWLWVLGLAVHLLVLLYMIDRFSLRYFVMFVLGVYVLAGVGAGEIVVRILKIWRRSRFTMSAVDWFIPVKAGGLAIALSAVWVAVVLVPFLRTGGSLAAFSLGNRTDSASALVDARPLIECLRGGERVSSENVHIYNRLQYVSHQYPELAFVEESNLDDAAWLVHYRDGKTAVPPGTAERCPDLAHFIVLPSTTSD